MAFVDMNNDGWLDLLSTNGHVIDSRPRIPLAMPPAALDGECGRSFEGRIGACRGAVPVVAPGPRPGSRDLDNDGRMDALVVNQNEPLVYLHNRTEKGGHFIRFNTGRHEVESERCGSAGDDQCGRAAADGGADRWRELSVGERSAAAFRAG